MTRVGLAVHRTFHSLHTRNFRLYFIGQVVSVTGTWLNATASAWLVLRLSNSGFALGVNTRAARSCRSCWSGRSAACWPTVTTSGRS